MSLSFNRFAALLAVMPCLIEAQSYNEPYRPQFHFSPAKNWTNDPNGLVYYQGEYHLFFQYNPFGDVWGHMSWGHAVSPDLIHWKELPVALAEENGIMIFSGSAVVDTNNSSGLCTGASCLIAIYTGHTSTLQTQNIAYSNDRGRTWTKYKGNPVIDLHMKDFRDPKVFWHAASKKWVMVAAIPKERKVRFFGSTDLKHWNALSDFGPAGATGGDWECPDLFPLPIEGEAGGTRWVLSVNLNPGARYGGSGNQYFVGDFDGSRFKDDNPSSKTLWVDYGKDFYASQSYNDVPDRRLFLGWLSNWQYAHDEPTSPFRCIQSVPRVLKLMKTSDGLRLIQEPVVELRGLRGIAMHAEKTDAAGVNRMLAGFKGTSYEITAEFAAGADFQFTVRKGATDGTQVGYSSHAGELFIDRLRSGNTSFSKEFAGRHAGPLTEHGGRLKVHILVDRSSVEVFGGDGEAVLSDRIFPAAGDDGLSFDGAAQVLSIEVWKLKPAWQRD